MTQGAVDLLARWVSENVHRVPREEIEDEAARLAAEFVAYARDAGLSSAERAELEVEIAEDLKSYMEDALEGLLTVDGGPAAGGE